MKIINKLAKVIVILFCLIITATFIVLYVSDSNYINKKICRNNSEIDINNYNNIDYVESVTLLDNCDKIIIYFKLNENINENNINAVILQIEHNKKIYNDNSSFEIILKNNQLNYLVIIDKDERIDIDFTIN